MGGGAPRGATKSAGTGKTVFGPISKNRGPGRGTVANPHPGARLAKNNRGGLRPSIFPVTGNSSHKGKFGRAPPCGATLPGPGLTGAGAPKLEAGPAYPAQGPAHEYPSEIPACVSPVGPGPGSPIRFPGVPRAPPARPRTWSNRDHVGPATDWARPRGSRGVAARLAGRRIPWIPASAKSGPEAKEAPSPMPSN